MIPLPIDSKNVNEKLLHEITFADGPLGSDPVLWYQPLFLKRLLTVEK
jgi:hypothetical protein